MATLNNLSIIKPKAPTKATARAETDAARKRKALEAYERESLGASSSAPTNTRNTQPSILAPKTAGGGPFTPKAPTLYTPPTAADARRATPPAPQNVAIAAPSRAQDPYGSTQTSAKAQPAPSAVGSLDKTAAMRRRALEQYEKDHAAGVPAGAHEAGRSEDRLGIQGGSASTTGTLAAPDGMTDRQRAAAEAKRRADALEALKRRRALENERNADPNALGDEVQQDFENQGNTGDAVGHAEEDADAVARVETGLTDEERRKQQALEALEREWRGERDAQAGELAAGRARDLMDVDARTGAAGFGLSGATAALRSDVSRKRDRSDTLAKAALGRSQRDEGREDRRTDAATKSAEAAARTAEADAAWRATQRHITSFEAENEAGEDLDGDGMIAGLTPDEYRRKKALEAAEAAAAAAKDDEDARDDGREDVDNDKVIARGPPPDARAYDDVWAGDSPPWGYRTGDDGEFVYVLGLDGHKWKVPIQLY